MRWDAADMDEALVVASYTRAVPARLARRREAEGIQAFVLDEQATTANPFLAPALGGVKITVAKENAAQARGDPGKGSAVSTLALGALASLAAGVMLAATFFSLLPQPIEAGGPWQALAGFFLGARLLILADRRTSHLRFLRGRAGPGSWPSRSGSGSTTCRKDWRWRCLW